MLLPLIESTAYLFTSLQSNQNLPNRHVSRIPRDIPHRISGITNGASGVTIAPDLLSKGSTRSFHQRFCMADHSVESAVCALISLLFGQQSES